MGELLKSIIIIIITCKYLSWRAAGESPITSDASLNALDAFCSPSAAITLARASLDASASAAIALCNCIGNRTSFLKQNVLTHVFDTCKIIIIIIIII